MQPNLKPATHYYDSVQRIVHFIFVLFCYYNDHGVCLINASKRSWGTDNLYQTYYINSYSTRIINIYTAFGNNFYLTDNISV